MIFDLWSLVVRESDEVQLNDNKQKKLEEEFFSGGLEERVWKKQLKEKK